MIEKLIVDAELLTPELNACLLTQELNDIVCVHSTRIKNKGSYIKRMNRLNQKPGEVDDLIGYCFLVENQSDCYKTLRLLKTNKDININKVLDYIKQPCGKNNYQAIHIKFEYKNTLGEIQIKTKEMDAINKTKYSNYKKTLIA